jgi:arylsulfatase A-like enzyme
LNLKCERKAANIPNRREVLKYGLYGGLVSALAPALWLSGCGKLLQRKKPNIILIVIDTLRFDHVSCYGYHRKITPNIDRLAQQSLLFKKAVSTAPWTLPSVASILTSRLPSILRIYEDYTTIDDRFPLLPQILKNYNYTNYGIVSSVLLSSSLGFNKGFDYYKEVDITRHAGISSPLITEKAVSCIRQGHNNPFFLFLHYFDPHYPFILHEQYKYHPSYKGRIKSGHHISDLWRIRHTLSQEDIRYLLSLYDSEIAFTDFHVGKLLNELINRDLYDNSIIIITSDHGEEFMERGWIGHTITLHQELIHVPLIMKLPGGKARIIDTPVGLIDIVPTLCKYLGFEIPDGLDGKALNLKGGSLAGSRPIYSETFNSQSNRPDAEPIAFVSVILDNWKLIHDGTTHTEQIYDLSSDPLEKSNLAGLNSEKSSMLAAQLSNWVNYVTIQESKPTTQDEREIFTPEQRKQLESLGYL